MGGGAHTAKLQGDLLHFWSDSKLAGNLWVAHHDPILTDFSPEAAAFDLRVRVTWRRTQVLAAVRASARVKSGISLKRTRQRGRLGQRRRFLIDIVIQLVQLHWHVFVVQTQHVISPMLLTGHNYLIPLLHLQEQILRKLFPFLIAHACCLVRAIWGISWRRSGSFFHYPPLSHICTARDVTLAQIESQFPFTVQAATAPIGHAGRSIDTALGCLEL